jgi:hypothetical protein
MDVKKVLITALALALTLPSIAEAKKKKKPPQRGMIESMQSIPCGAKARGLTGLGSIFGSVGIEHVNSNEKLCPQYLFRTDELDYHIRPLDLKHAVLLPVGHEGEFKIKKDRLYLRVPDEDKKTREYLVVAVEPVKSSSGVESTAYRPAYKPTESRPADRVANQRTSSTPPQNNSVPPQ